MVLLPDYAKNVPILNKQLAQKEINISDKFKQLVVRGRFKENHYRVQKIDFIGIGNEVRIKGGGHIFPLNEKKQGVIALTLSGHKRALGKRLKKIIGTNTVPVRLKGVGLALSPDYPYTVKKIAQSVAKAKGKRALKRRGKKILNKYLKGKGQQGVKKLLKGVFN